MYDELLFTVNGDAASKVHRQSMEELELEERKHLQQWVLSNPEVLGPSVLVITSEFDRWQSADGAKVADRLDILAMDADGHLVVVELKRGYAPHTVHMQAINYAAMVSRLTPEDIADIFGRVRPRPDAPPIPRLRSTCSRPSTCSQRRGSVAHASC